MTSEVVAPSAQAPPPAASKQNVPGIVYVSFTAEINPTTAQALIAQCATLANNGASTIYLLLSTPGGHVREGMAIYNILRALPVKLITHNVGNVDSIGNVAFLAGEERYACPNSTFMFHGVGQTLQGTFRLEEKDVKEKLDSIQADNARIASIIENRCTFDDAAEVRNLFLESRTKDTDFAKSRGLIHDVREVQVPTGAPVFQLVFQG